MSETTRFQRTRLAIAVGAAMSLGSAQVLAAEGAGRVLTTRGQVYAVTQDGSTRALQKGGHVYAGDTIETREGRLQIRFHDGALVSLKPGTEFAIDEYVTESESSDGDGNAAMRLLKGAMRTITGAINDEGGDDYSVETPVATIGIRGTHYALQYCGGGACGGQAEGLYGQVIDNQVTVENQAGAGSFGSGRYFQVPSSDTAPEAIVNPPGSVLRRAESQGEAEENDTAEPDDQDTGGDDQDDTTAVDPGDDSLASSDTAVSVETEDLSDDTDSEVTTEYSQTDEAGVEVAESEDGAIGIDTNLLTSSMVGATAASTQFGAPFFLPVCRSDAVCQGGVDENGNLRELVFSIGGEGVELDATSGVTLANSGQVSALDAQWGRWTGDIVVKDGSNQQTLKGDMPWAYSNTPTPTGTLTDKFSGGGQLTFDIPSGPSPVGTELGTDWAVTGARVTMNYSGGQATIPLESANLDLSVSGGPSLFLSNFSGGSTVIDPGSGDQGFTLNLDESGGSAGGTFTGRFVGSNGNGLIVDFQTATGAETITGVKILER